MLYSLTAWNMPFLMVSSALCAARRQSESARKEEVLRIAKIEYESAPLIKIARTIVAIITTESTMPLRLVLSFFMFDSSSYAMVCVLLGHYLCLDRLLLAVRPAAHAHLHDRVNADHPVANQRERRRAVPENNLPAGKPARPELLGGF